MTELLPLYNRHSTGAVKKRFGFTLHDTISDSDSEISDIEPLIETANQMAIPAAGSFFKSDTGGDTGGDIGGDTGSDTGGDTGLSSVDCEPDPDFLFGFAFKENDIEWLYKLKFVIFKDFPGYFKIDPQNQILYYLNKEVVQFIITSIFQVKITTEYEEIVIKEKLSRTELFNILISTRHRQIDIYNSEGQPVPYSKILERWDEMHTPSFIKWLKKKLY
jgi:hypothetical protein